jgi:acetyl esterase/lipase
MKITKDMLDEELQEKYWSMMFAGFMLSQVWMVKLINRLSASRKGANIEGLHCEEKYIPSRNGGPDIRIRLFKPLNSTAELPGMLYIHGGGYITALPEGFFEIIKQFIEAKPCVIIAPDYRKALEAPYPAALDDCYDTLLWLKENAQTLGVIPEKFIVGGHSAGGGLTAAVTLKATDTNDVQIAFQMPIYPMMDDRQLSESAANSNAPVWNSKTNKLGWSLYLKDLKEKNREIPPYAAASRATDYSNLPPTITFVGDLEPFRDETIEYVENLKKAGIPVAFELYHGCFHGFDTLVPEAEVSQTAVRFLLESYSQSVDKYIPEANNPAPKQ